MIYPLYTYGSTLPVRLWPVVRPTNEDDENCFIRDGWATVTAEVASASGMQLPSDDKELVPKLVEALEAVTGSLAAWMEIADPEDVRSYDEEALAAARTLINDNKGV